MGFNPIKAIAGVGGAILGGPVGALLGGAIPGVIDAVSGTTSAKMSRDAYKHRYQDTVKDMRKAGLNPALAYGQGGGGGAQGQELPQIGSSIARGMQAFSSARQGAATADLIGSQAALLKAQSADLIDQVRLRNEVFKTQAKLQEEQTFLTSARGTVEREHAAQIRQATENLRQQYLWTQATWDKKIALIERELTQRGVSIRRTEIENVLLQLQQPEAEAGAAFFSGAGKYSPYVNSALDIVRTLIPKITLGGRAVETITNTKMGRGYKTTTSTRRNVK